MFLCVPYVCVLEAVVRSVGGLNNVLNCKRGTLSKPRGSVVFNILFIIPGYNLLQ